MIGKHERAALERERTTLLARGDKSQMEGRRLDEIEALLGGKDVGVFSDLLGNDKPLFEKIFGPNRG